MEHSGSVGYIPTRAFRVPKTSCDPNLIAHKQLVYRKIKIAVQRMQQSAHQPVFRVPASSSSSLWQDIARLGPDQGDRGVTPRAGVAGSVVVLKLFRLRHQSDVGYPICGWSTG